MIYIYILNRLKKKGYLSKKKIITKAIQISRNVIIGLSFITIISLIIFNINNTIKYKKQTESEKKLEKAIDNLNSLDINEMDSVKLHDLNKSVQEVIKEDNK